MLLPLPVLGPRSDKAQDLAAQLCARAVIPFPITAQPEQGPHIYPCVQDKDLLELQGSSIIQLTSGTCTWAAPLQKPGVRSKEQASPTYGTVRLPQTKSMWEVSRKSRN